MKRVLSLILSMSLCAFLLTSCAKAQELTADQEEMISQYAVSLLLKYDEQNHSRLVDTTKYLASYQAAKDSYDRAEKLYYENAAKEEEERRAEAKAQEELNNQYTEETSTEEPFKEDVDRSGGAMVVDAGSIEDVLGLDGFNIDYTGCEVVDTYADSDGFVLSSNKGMDLLIVEFNVSNSFSSDNNFSTSTSAVFKLSVNEDHYYSRMMTMLVDEDLSLYQGTFAPGESKRLVLVTQVKEGTQVSSLGLRVSMGDDTVTKKLQ